MRVMRTKLTGVKKAVSMKASMNGSHPVIFYWLRCDIQSCKTWYHDFCVDVLLISFTQVENLQYICPRCFQNCANSHRMDKRKSFVFPRQYRNCFSQRIIALLSIN